MKKKISNFLLIHVKQLWDKEYANKYFINCVFQELFAAMYEKCFARCIGSNGTRSWQYDKFGWHYSRLNWFYLAEFLWNEQIMGANATPGTFKVQLIFNRMIWYLIFFYPKDILWIFGVAFERNMAIITRHLWIKSFVS